MSSLATALRVARRALAGHRFCDKRLAFLLGAHASLGDHRHLLHAWFRRRIGKFGRRGQVELEWMADGHVARISLREGDEADYLVGGELVNGSYDAPDFVPDVIIDGGANIGLFTVYAAHKFPRARIVCYEPEHENFTQLRHNVSANGIDARFIRAGLWSRETKLYFHRQASYSGFVDEHPPGDAIECVFPEVSESCWLKLDIEGAEYEVLPELLRRGTLPRWITLELHEFSRRGSSMLDALRSHGYRVTGGENPQAMCANVTAIRAA